MSNNTRTDGQTRTRANLFRLLDEQNGRQGRAPQARCGFSSAEFTGRIYGPNLRARIYVGLACAHGTSSPRRARNCLFRSSISEKISRPSQACLAVRVLFDIVKRRSLLVRP